MDFFSELINNPNFGRLFTGSKSFRTLFNTMVGHSEDPKVQEINKKLRFGTDVSGNLVLESKELNHTFQQGAGETPGDFLTRVLTGKSQRSTPANLPGPKNPWEDPTRGKGFDYLKSSELIEPDVTYETMAARNFRLGRATMERVARERNLRIRYSTLEGGPNSLEAAYDMVGRNELGEPLGIVRADEKIHRVAEFWDKTGRKLPYSEAMQALGISPDRMSSTQTVNKRLNAFFNAPQITIDFDKPGDFKRATFDPTSFYKKDELTKKRTEHIANLRIEEKTKGLTAKEASVFKDANYDNYLDEIYSSYSDGQILMDEEIFKRHVKKMKAQYVNQATLTLQRKFDHGVISPAKYERELAQIREVAKTFENLDQQIKDGLKMNMRAVGGIDVTDPDNVFSFAKGDLVLINKADKRAILRRIGGIFSEMSDKKLDEIVFITDKGNQKTELGPLKKVRPFMTLDTVANRYEESWTNTIALSSYGDMQNPLMPSGKRFLQESFEIEWSKQVEQIARGDIGGLNTLIDEINKINTDNYDGSELQDILDNKAYARRLRDFIDSGGSVEMNESMINDLYRISRSKFFRERKFGKTIRLEGKDVKDLALRIPQTRSTRAHLTTKADMTQVNNYITDRLSLNLNPDIGFDAKLKVGTSTLGLNGSDIEMIKAAFGGMDLDDALSLNTYVYDPETKRMMTFITRDPASLGEYMYMDAQFGRDRHFRTAEVEFVDRQQNGKTVKRTIGSLTDERKQILNQIEDLGNKIKYRSTYGKEKSLKLQTLFTRLSDINESLGTYLEGDQLLPKLDLAKQYALDEATQAFNRVFAPLGWRTTNESLAGYSERSILRSYGSFSDEELSLANVGKLMQRFGREIDMEELGNARLPFEFAAETPRFTEFLTGEGGVGESDLFVDFEKEYADRVAEAERPAVKKVLTRAQQIAETKRLNKATAEAQYLLGRVVNATTIINEAIVNNTTLQEGGLTAEEITRFKEIVKKNQRIVYMPRESIIDPITKTGNIEYLELIKDVNKRNLRTIGRIMGEAGPRFGLDPVTLAQRGGLKYMDETMENLIGQDFSEILAGYRETSKVSKDVTNEELIERLSLKADDPRARISRLLQQQIQFEQDTIAEARAVRETANENLLSLIEGRNAEGERIKNIQEIVPTPVEQARADEWLDEFYREDRARRGLTGSTSDEMLAFLQSALEGDIDATGDLSDILSDVTKNEINTSSIRRLQKAGLFEDREALYRQLLINAQTAIKNQQATDEMGYEALRPLSQVTTREGEASIVELFGEAQRWRQEQMIREEVKSLAHDWHGFGTIDEYFKDVINPTIGKRGQMRDTIAFQRARLEAIEIMRSRGGKGYVKTMEGIADKMVITPRDRGMTPREAAELPADEEFDYLRTTMDDMAEIEQRAGRPIEDLPIPGTRRLREREISDIASSEVRRWKPMKNLNRQAIDELLSKPGFRKGLGAAAIFAGLGFFHAMRGDRTPEQMAGPPLLPGGSSYEQLPTEQLPRPVVIPISQQGYTYKVRAQGNFDAQSLSSELGNITGSNVNGTIYESQQRYNPTGMPRASDILNSLITGY